PAPIKFIRLKLFDFYQVFQPREITPQPVAIVDIDEEAIAAFGQWPWPRTQVAKLVTAITQAGAVAMAFDIVFSEPDRLSPHLLAENLPNLDEATRAVLRETQSNDAVLAAAFAGSRVIVGQSGKLTANEGSEQDPGQTSIATLGGDPTPYLYNYPGLLRNIEILDKSAAGRAMFNVLPELGGVVRRVPLLMIADGLILPSLVAELLRVATGSNAILVKVNQAGVKSIVVGGVDVPTDANGQLWVHFTRHDRNRFVSARDILEGSPRALQALRGKLVFIGTSAIGLHDVISTPVDAAIPGVEVHAQVLETILAKSFLKRPNDMLGLELFITLLVSIAIIWVAPKFGPVQVFGFGFLVAMGVVAKSWYEFTVNHVLLDVGFPLGSSMAIFLVMVFINYFREEAQKRQVRGAFGQYISPDLVEQLAREPDKLTLGGESKQLTVLFSDVRGFTAISELYKDDPQGLTRLMNRLLTPLSNAIIASNGTIDKYMG
ncbi:MAG: CHASE2 domain-containing protein, partial [Fimbriimonadaceae bacterium]|nr:CHASE2 domain-containing protein [Alphaproteobacteria bacterium]